MLSLIPKLWRFTLAAIVALVALVGAVVIATRLTHSEYSCLYLDGAETALLDVNSGKSYSYPTWTPELTLAGLGSHIPYVLSPDSRRVAYFKNTNSGTLVVRSFQRPVPALQRSAFNTFSDATASDIMWSPDQQYIAYHWFEGDTHYLAIADANGNLIHRIYLNVIPNDKIGFDSWSADGKYIALTSDIQGRRASISLLSVPDLQLVDLGEDSSEVGAGCQSAETESSWWHCVPWSAQGHTAAYTITRSSGKVQLIITTPGDSTRQVVDLPDSQSQLVRWSPNGQWIAVASYNPGPGYTGRSAQLDLFSADGKVRLDMGTAVESNIFVSGTTINAVMQWSMDGSLLFYSQMNPTDNSKYDLMVFRIDTNQKIRLFSQQRAWPSDTVFYPSTGDQYAADTDKSLALISIPDASRSVLSDLPAYTSLFWSPDSARMAYTVGSADQNTLSVKVISNTGSPLAAFHYDNPIYSISWTQCDAHN